MSERYAGATAMSGRSELSDDTIALLAVAGERVNHEHELISHRMTWLMALNGFLVAGFAILIVNADGMPPDANLAFVVVGIGALGALANLSCFFSNFWATTSIFEVRETLSKIIQGSDGPDAVGQPWGPLAWLYRVMPPWRAHPPAPAETADSPETRVAGEADERYADRLRLYGFDPRRRAGVPMGRRFATPPSKVLHPWHVLPLAFCASFTALPVFVGASSIPHVHVSGVTPFVPLMVVAVFCGLALADISHHKRWGPAAARPIDPSPGD